MISWPELGTRVAVRYRRPAGSVPPLTDAVGHLLEVAPLVRVQTKAGAVVQFASDDVIALRTLSDKPLRASEIRALEHAAALASPGVEQEWLDGWFLRAGDDVNYAVPLGTAAAQVTLPVIVEWYRRRGLTPRLLIPERLLRISHDGEHPSQMLVCDVPGARPRDEQSSHDAATVTDAPDGTRWVGLSAAPSLAVCEALLAWGGHNGATRGYLRVADADAATMALARSAGFVLHHRARYVTLAT